MTGVNTMLAPALPSTAYYNSKKLLGAGKRTRHRRKQMHGGFFGSIIRGAAGAATTRAVDRAFNCLQIKNAEDLADKVTKKLINNALDIPQQRLSAYKRKQIMKLKNLKNSKIKKLPKPLRKILT